MGQPVVDVQLDGEVVQHLLHAADVVGVRVGGDHEVEVIDALAHQLLVDVAFGLGGIDEDDLVGRSPNEDAVSLADVEHIDTKITSEDRADKREEHHHGCLAPHAAGYERRINSLRRRDNLRPSFYKLPNHTLREV